MSKKTSIVIPGPETPKASAKTAEETTEAKKIRDTHETAEAKKISETKEVHDVRALTDALSAPFAVEEVKWKPQAIKNNRALAVAYVDVRVIQDRLDEVLGVEGWQDEYQLLPDGSVMCRLRLKLGKRWITKMDVGSPSEQPDGGDRLKAAFSDALKRAAVKFGIGRYLYRLPVQWADYDPTKKQFVKTPILPPLARPKAVPQASTTPRRAPAAPTPVLSEPTLASVSATATEAASVSRTPSTSTVPSPTSSNAKTSATKPAASHAHLPTNGAELHRRLRDYDAKLAAQGLCPLGALLTHVTQAGVQAGFGADLTLWTGNAITLAVEETKAFEASLRRQTQAKTNDEAKAVA